MATVFARPIRVVDRILLRDTARNRLVPIKSFYPLAPGRYPLLIFSHGLGATKDTYDFLGRFWASAGYVVVHPTHFGSDAAAVGPAVIRLIAGRMGPSEIERRLADRTIDVSFLLSSLAALEEAAPALRSKIDPKRVGVAGHSAGAATALLLAGATLRACAGGRRAFYDERVGAFVALSPVGSGFVGFDRESWRDVRKPMLTMTGSADVGIIARSLDWRREPFDGMPAGNKYHVVVTGANHYSFADLRRQAWIEPLLRFGEFGDKVRLRACIAYLTTTFWNLHLKGETRLLQRTGFADIAAIASK